MQHALELDPNNYIAHVHLGVYYARLGQDKAAKFHRARVRELDPAVRVQPEAASVSRALPLASGPIAVVTPQ